MTFRQTAMLVVHAQNHVGATRRCPFAEREQPRADASTWPPAELAQEKLTPLLRLKYNNAIADAVADLGKPEEIGKVFTGFQKYLYNQAA